MMQGLLLKSSIFLICNFILITGSYGQNSVANTFNPSPKMQVKAFELDEAEEFPELGLSVSEINTIVELKRKTYVHGFDIHNLSAITELVTQYYREAGLVLTTAYLPEQEVDDDTLVIKIIYGKLAQMSTEANVLYKSGQLLLPFEKLFNIPVNIYQMETATLLMNDYPGYTGTAVFVPGDVGGTSAILIKTIEEDSLQPELWFDNYGTESTGEYRLRAGLTFNNLAGLEDRLAINLVQALQPANSLFGSIDYSGLFFSPATRLGTSFTLSSYEVGGILADLGVTGDSEVIRFYGQHYLSRKKKANLYATADLSLKKAASEGLGQLTEDALTVFSGGIGFDSQTAWFGGRHGGSLSVDFGLEDFLGSMDGTGNDKSSRVLTDGSRAGGGFAKVNANYSYALPLSFHRILNNSYFLFRTSIQQSGDELVSIERMSLGGPMSVRGYPIAEYLADSGQLFSFEFVSRAAPIEEAPWLSNLQLSVFYDYGSGESNNALVNEEGSLTLSAIGFGVQLLPKKGFQAKLDFGIPMGEDPSNDKSVQIYLNLGYRF
jgi:hemolysin activation/secretion protein